MASRSSRCRCAERASRSTPRFARSQLHAASRRSAAFRTRPRNTAMPVRRPNTRSAVRARQPRIIDRLASKLGGGWRRRIDPARLFAAAERDAQAFVFASDGSTVGFEENYTDALDCYRLAIEVRWRHGARVSTWKGADPPPPGARPSRPLMMGRAAAAPPHGPAHVGNGPVQRAGRPAARACASGRRRWRYRRGAVAGRLTGSPLARITTHNARPRARRWLGTTKPSRAGAPA